MVGILLNRHFCHKRRDSIISVPPPHAQSAAAMPLYDVILPKDSKDLQLRMSMDANLAYGTLYDT